MQQMQAATEDLTAPTLPSNAKATSMDDRWNRFSVEEKAKLMKEAANHSARNMAAMLVHSEVAKAGKSLRELEREFGLQPAVISRITTASLDRGPDLATLCRIAMALGKNMHITFEDPIADDD